MEQWKGIEGYPNYEVSNMGEVRVANSSIRLTPRINNRGRIQYRLFNEDGSTYPQVHRLVLEAFVGPCPEGYECRHLDGNPQNNQVSNLAWGTRSENMQDKVRHGTAGRGGRPYRFNDEEVAQIKADKFSGMTYRQLAKKYNCGMAPISDALLRR